MRQLFKAIAPALLLCLLASPAWTQTAPESPSADAEAGAIEPEKIVIVGQRPGPGLWKVSKGDHVLWVFGTYSPLLTNMQWRSQQVESILAQSQEYLPAPSARPDMGVLRMLTLLPFAIGVTSLPNGGRLRDVLPPDVYARWLLMKEKYIGADAGIEENRPIFAAETLFQRGLHRAGLASGSAVLATIEKIVKKHSIKTTPSEIKVAVDSPISTLREFKKSTIGDADCLAKTMDQLETDIDAMRLRANAWAKGDLEVIQKLNFVDRDAACASAIIDSALFKKQAGFSSFEERLRDVWIATVEKSLANNASTFAVLPLQTILDPKGYLADLQAKGYVVEKPE